MKKIFALLVVTSLMVSCVSKKKYVQLEEDLMNTKGELQKTTVEKEELEAKFAKIEKRVEIYNNQINSLQSDNASLTESNNQKLDMLSDNSVVMSENMKTQLNEVLAKLPPEALKDAKTLKDSMNVAISYNLNKSISENNIGNDGDIDVNIDQTVVMISVADSLLFRSGSYTVSSKAKPLLEKLADVINAEPSIDVMIEGHTDSKGIHTADIVDNWDLSVKRSTAIVRILQNKYKVDPARLIPSGRSSYVPLTDNSTYKNRARNRRTNIIIMPNLNKFFALMAEEEVVSLED
ncbi:OmpA family protein [Lutimonas zeaxanthinifaciens]|uniref:OmpA family protein n=1 Tax=Lutimonas zeaxanthinifaciens TaxID=3060215 RepID=UPI00265CC1AF|nr:OmpA family protein [Lutimonas sp. YSD2104]WKK65385.1 OmpA family protein [Lutimonas sp. YSD2104]